LKKTQKEKRLTTKIQPENKIEDSNTMLKEIMQTLQKMQNSQQQQFQELHQITTREMRELQQISNFKLSKLEDQLKGVKESLISDDIKYVYLH